MPMRNELSEPLRNRTSVREGKKCYPRLIIMTFYPEYIIRQFKGKENAGAVMHNLLSSKSIKIVLYSTK